MKKIVKVTILLLVFMLFLTGCEYEARMEMSIDQDGKIELNKVLLMDDEMIDALITASEDESQFQIENPSDFKIAKHTDEERWAFIEKDSSDGSIDFTLKEEGSKRYTGKNGYKGFYNGTCVCRRKTMRWYP